jgi:hypothetical protein
MIDGQHFNLALGSSDSIPVAHLLSPHRSATCCARIRRGAETGWCHLPDGHDGSHDGVLSTPDVADTYGPRSKR